MLMNVENLNFQSENFFSEIVKVNPKSTTLSDKYVKELKKILKRQIMRYQK